MKFVILVCCALLVAGLGLVRANEEEELSPKERLLIKGLLRRVGAVLKSVKTHVIPSVAHTLKSLLGKPAEVVDAAAGAAGEAAGAADAAAGAAGEAAADAAGAAGEAADAAAA